MWGERYEIVLPGRWVNWEIESSAAWGGCWGPTSGLWSKIECETRHHGYAVCFFLKNFFLEQISASSLEVQNKQRREFNCELGFLQENIKRNKNFENLWGDVIIMMCLESKLDKEGLEVTRVWWRFGLEVLVSSKKSCKQSVLESMAWKLRIVSERDARIGVLKMLQLFVIIAVGKR